MMKSKRKIINRYQDYFWWLILAIGIIWVIATLAYTLDSTISNFKHILSQKEEITNIFQAALVIIKIFALDIYFYIVSMLLATKMILFSYSKVSRNKKFTRQVIKKIIRFSRKAKNE